MPLDQRTLVRLTRRDIVDSGLAQSPRGIAAIESLYRVAFDISPKDIDIAQDAADAADGKATTAKARADDAYSNAEGRQPASDVLDALAMLDSGEGAVFRNDDDSFTIVPIADLTGTGWANYVDGAPSQVLTANTRTLWTNDAATVDETQLPTDVDTLWTGNRITGRNGDAFVARVKMNVTPSDATASFLRLQLDIGTDAPIVINEKKFPIIDGAGVAHELDDTVAGFNRETFEANGCALYVTSDGPVTISAKSIFVVITHRGR